MNLPLNTLMRYKSDYYQASTVLIGIGVFCLAVALIAGASFLHTYLRRQDNGNLVYASDKQYDENRVSLIFLLVSATCCFACIFAALFYTNGIGGDGTTNVNRTYFDIKVITARRNDLNKTQTKIDEHYDPFRIIDDDKSIQAVTQSKQFKSIKAGQIAQRKYQRAKDDLTRIHDKTLPPSEQDDDVAQSALKHVSSPSKLTMFLTNFRK